ncbi:MAG: galactokinase [Candidatus Aldehydirespiratoraceae bacterium]
MVIKAAWDRAISAHRRDWGEPEFVVRAPGRVNLIGEHTDYNDGFVLPMALPFDAVIAVSRTEDGLAIVRSEGFGDARLGASGAPSWSAHLQELDRLMAEDGIEAGSWRGAMTSDIPAGASLSSSAAIEVAVALAISHLADAPLAPIKLAEYGQRVETALMGAPTGIMDQLISATAQEGSASFIDTRTLEVTPVPMPDDASVVVMDTMTRRELVDSEFSERMATCRRAAELLGVAALRDVDDVSSLKDVYPREWQRASHVVDEDRRTLEAVAALRAGDSARFGVLMGESHASLRDLYEVSGPALDQIVEIAAAAPGCHGARMTGGGFAGCAVALVAAGAASTFVAHVAEQYKAGSGVTPRLWVCEPAAGARLKVMT